VGRRFLAPPCVEEPILTTLSNRYAGPVIALHWLMFLLVVLAYASIELREFFPKDRDRTSACRLA
jgi:cytochrome b561